MIWSRNIFSVVLTYLYLWLNFQTGKLADKSLIHSVQCKPDLNLVPTVSSVEQSWWVLSIWTLRFYPVESVGECGAWCLINQPAPDWGGGVRGYKTGVGIKKTLYYFEHRKPSTSQMQAWQCGVPCRMSLMHVMISAELPRCWQSVQASEIIALSGCYHSLEAYGWSRPRSRGCQWWSRRPPGAWRAGVFSPWNRQRNLNCRNQAKLNQIKWTVMVGVYTCTPLAWSIKR